jgi:hypothetical protein
MYMRKIPRSVFLILVLLFSGIKIPVHAHEKPDSVEVLEPLLTLNYLCINPDSVSLTATLLIRKETGIFNLENAGIEFTASADNNSKKLGKVSTNAEGIARMVIPFSAGLPVDKEGKTTYTVSFSGSLKYAAATATETAKRARIMVTFFQQDSVRNIHIKAVQVEGNGQEKPISKETVNIYIPRLFTLLKIGETDLDENGEGTMVFPDKLVGDSLGNITVVGRIEESDLFGNAEGRSSVSWGIPKQYYTAEHPTRELWTPIAPIWMIITLIIMLTGVWAHYIYAVIQMLMIKRHSKQKKEYL